ncbi:MAG: acetolactate synthase small subunit [Clostridia bacterium]|jgi:acetolactate synthase-1/3 small subunit|nr:acetolactate synthase small subunit [Clostridia bacterium]
MEKRWICLFVENEIGVLARISGLFSSKSYNIESLTVGTTEDPTISRMTISMISDDKTFEQIKKQLNRSVEVIKVVDYTTVQTHMKEILYIKVYSLTDKDKTEIFRLAQVYNLKILDYNKNSVIIEWTEIESKIDEMIEMFKSTFLNRVEVVRGGSVAIEAIGISNR